MATESPDHDELKKIVKELNDNQAKAGRDTTVAQPKDSDKDD